MSISPKPGPWIERLLYTVLGVVVGLGGQLIYNDFVGSPTIDTPAEVRGKPGRMTHLQASAWRSVLKWSTEDDADLDDRGGGNAVFLAPRDGTYRATVSATRWFGHATRDVTVIIGAGPGPVPPGPVPPVPPAPTRVTRALIVYDSATVTALPAGQQAILFGKASRDALDAKTGLAADGKQHDWNIFDQNVDASSLPKVWGDWLKRPRPTMPWIVLGGDAGVAFEGPLPADPAAFAALLTKYASWG